MKRYIAIAALALTAAFAGPAAEALAKEYLITGVRPGKLVLIDARARTVERVYDIPDATPGPGPSTIVASPDGKVAYVTVNRWESVSGIDLDTGEQVFRADFSSPDIRVKAIFAMDISPDGKELYVALAPVKLLPGEYQVQDARIAVYNTADGVGAEPVRFLPVPRQTAILASSTDGKRLYAVNREVTIIDSQSGDVIDVYPTQAWDRPTFYPPDIIDIWPQWEQAQVFSTLYYTARSDISLEDPTAWWTGMLTIDLASGDIAIKEFENTAGFYFSSVVDPVKRNIAYGVYLTLAKIDFVSGETLASVPLDHSYYDVNISSDGTELYVGGTMSDIAVYSTETLEKIGSIEMPEGANQALASLRIIQR